MHSDDPRTIQKQKLYDEYIQRLTPERRSKIEANAQERTRYISLILEDVYQLHNMSAVLRSCDCFGIQDVHVIEERNHYKKVALVFGTEFNSKDYGTRERTSALSFRSKNHSLVNQRSLRMCRKNIIGYLLTNNIQSNVWPTNANR